MGLSGRKLLIKKIMILLLLATYGFAQEVKVKSIVPFLKSKKLVIKAEFENLLNKELIDGLASGMTRTLKFQFNIIQKGGKKISEIGRLVTLQYDVWEDVYYLTNRKQKKQFEQFEKFKSFLHDSLNFTLLSHKRLSLEKSIQVILYLSPENISENQKIKLDYWMANATNSEKKSNDGENQSGFSFNLSGIISLFTSGEIPKNATVGQSKFFTIKSLK